MDTASRHRGADIGYVLPILDAWFRLLQEKIIEDVHHDAVSKSVQIVMYHIYHDFRDKDTVPGQNLSNTSPGSAPVQFRSFKLSG